MADPQVSVRALTQPLESGTQADILALWAAEKAEIPDTQARLKEIAYVAYAGADLVGVASAKLVRECHTRQLFYALRVLVRADWRQNLLAFEMLAQLIEDKQDAFAAGNDLRALGILLEIEAAFAITRKSIYASRSYQFPMNKTPLDLYFIGFDNRGIREFIHYFPGAKLTMEPPQAPRLKPAADAAGPPALALKLVTQPLAPEPREALIRLWLDCGVLPDREACLARLPQVAAIAYEEERVVAVATVFPVRVPQLRITLLGYRSFVAPSARGSQTATELLNLVFADRNERYRREEDDAALPGMVYVLQNSRLNVSVTDTISPRTGFLFAGLDEAGRQLRIRYFDKAVLTFES